MSSARGRAPPAATGSRARRRGERRPATSAAARAARGRGGAGGRAQAPAPRRQRRCTRAQPAPSGGRSSRRQDVARRDHAQARRCGAGRRAARGTRSRRWSALSPRRGSRPSCFMTRPAIVSSLVLGRSAPKYSLNSSMRVTPRTVNWRSRVAADVLVVLDVELVVDLADDLLDHVLDGAQARRRRRTHRPRSPCGCGCARNSLSSTFRRLDSGTNTAGRMYSRMSKRSRAWRWSRAQQVLGEQDADDVVAVLVHHREARVARLDHHRQDARGRIVAPHEHHLRARHHDVAHLQVADRAARPRACRARRHRPGRARGLAQHREQLRAVLRLAGQAVRQALQPAAGGARGPWPSLQSSGRGWRSRGARSTAISRRSMRRASRGALVVVADRCSVPCTTRCAQCARSVLPCARASRAARRAQITRSPERRAPRPPRGQRRGRKRQHVGRRDRGRGSARLRRAALGAADHRAQAELAPRAPRRPSAAPRPASHSIAARRQPARAPAGAAGVRARRRRAARLTGEPRARLVGLHDALHERVAHHVLRRRRR